MIVSFTCRRRWHALALLHRNKQVALKNLHQDREYAAPPSLVALPSAGSLGAEAPVTVVLTNCYGSRIASLDWVYLTLTSPSYDSQVIRGPMARG